MKSALKGLKWMAIIVIALWIVLTIWVEAEGPARIVEIGNSRSEQTALVVYDPDPFFNLDQQVCESFSKALADHGWKVTIATVKMAKKIKEKPFSLYVFCANTYNWLPDWSVAAYIKRQAPIKDKNILAITLGAGSTAHSQKILNKLITQKGGKLLDSKSLWLLRPNDKAGTNESNIQKAVAAAKNWAEKLGDINKSGDE